jgi:hypothetical protein
MAGNRYEITGVIFETPRYVQAPHSGDVTEPMSAIGPSFAGGPMSLMTPGEHDLIGAGWVEIVDSELVVAIRELGIVAHLEPKEKRTYPLTDVVVWHRAGAIVNVGFGRSGPVATNGSDAPAHLGTMKFADVATASAFTAEATKAGVVISEPPRHSGI